MRTILIIFFFLWSCSPRIDVSRSNYDLSEKEDYPSQKENLYLKVHLKNGKLAIINSWEINDETKLIKGNGIVYDASRNKNKSYPIKNVEIDYEECVLLETNDYRGFNVISPLLMTLTVFTAGFTITCIANPKSCFGSCPTYYLHHNDSLIIKAEGFSSSITKSMEEIDVDYLTEYKGADNNELKIELKNEALETHYIRRSEILAIEKSGNYRIYYGEEKFFTTTQLTLPNYAHSAGEDITNLLNFNDGKEYIASSDSINISKKESIILEFDELDGETAGIVITQRQSLMTTFLFYQSLAYMGTKVGDLMAAYERASPIVRNAQKNMYDILGGIEASVFINGKWRTAGTIFEQGPIVSDTHIIPVDFLGKFSKVRLTMTKGLWRIDQVSLCTIINEVEPIIIKPTNLLKDGIVESDLIERLNNPEKMLVTNPGTSYTLIYHLPKKNNFSLFLKSQGYYTEWMRNQWLQEEDQEMTKMIIRHPNEWLKLMSPKYKLVERKMDSLFWSSKFGNIEY